jgi:hypothetical protein
MIRIITPQIKDRFAVSWDVAKHIGDMGLFGYGLGDVAVCFYNNDYSLVCRDEINNVFEYKNLFEKIKDDSEYRITLDKEEDLSFIDAVLMNYKSPDKKIDVRIFEDRAVIMANDSKQEQEIRANIDVKKYDAGEEDGFRINPDYFQEVVKKYDWFVVLDGMVYCHNAVNGVDRIVSIMNL